jgi:hypothetical protein
MGYYIRVLGKNLTTIPVQELRDVALPAVVDVTEGSTDMWEQLTLKHKSGQEIAVIERNPVAEGEFSHTSSSASVGFLADMESIRFHFMNRYARSHSTAIAPRTIASVQSPF